MINSDDSNPVPENVVLDLGSYPIIVSPGLYEFFLDHGKVGLEALLLYLHLQYTARRQKTNRVWARDAYLSGGLKFGKLKIKTLKAFLHKHRLIEYHQDHEFGGKYGEVYIKLPYIHRKETVEKAVARLRVV